MKKMPFTLEEIVTRDGLLHQGILAEPRKKSKRALVYVSGLGSTFYGGVARLEALAHAALRQNVAFASFNTRGHDIVAGLKKKDAAVPSGYGFTLGGEAFERFEESPEDIRAVLDFLAAKGYRDVILTGHSTGANKVLYYMYTEKDVRVKGLGLLSPVSDIPGQRKKLGRKFDTVLHTVKTLAKKTPDALLPRDLVGGSLYTAQRYVSLFESGSAEDVFPYYHSKPSFQELGSVRVPLLVLIGDQDEYLDRPVQDFVASFHTHANATPQFTAAVLAGGSHSFLGREQEYADSIMDWISHINTKPF